MRTHPPLTCAGWLRHDVVRRALRETTNVRSVLEVGAGEGAFGLRLASVYSYTGLEPDPEAFATAERRLAELGRGTIVNGAIEALGPEDRFDLICAFEVLEHIAHPIAALASWRSHLQEGGWLMLTVPAGRGRLGAADRLVGHYRRYQPELLHQQLTAAGFLVVRLERFGFPLGGLLELIRNSLAAVQLHTPGRAAPAPGGGRWLQPPDRLAWASRAATAPFRWSEARRPSGRGPSLFALARQAPDAQQQRPAHEP